jgi:hypothetical protein
MIVDAEREMLSHLDDLAGNAKVVHPADLMPGIAAEKVEEASVRVRAECDAMRAVVVAGFVVMRAEVNRCRGGSS